MAEQPAAPRWRRDPQRRQRIIDAAAELVAERGFHDVGMAEIGAAAGVTGSAIYRHFEGKSALLVAMFDRVVDDLAAEAAAIVEDSDAPDVTLRRLVAGLADQVTGSRAVMQVYHREIANLPPADGRRLRRKQRLYVEEWVHVLGALRAELTDADLRAIVHAAVGAIQSALFYKSGLPVDRERALLCSAAEAVLSLPPHPEESP